MLRLLAILLLAGCAHATKDATRDAVNAHHAQCQERAQARRDVDAYALIRCDVVENEECRAAGLEKWCGEWR